MKTTKKNTKSISLFTKIILTIMITITSLGGYVIYQLDSQLNLSYDEYMNQPIEDKEKIDTILNLFTF